MKKHIYTSQLDLFNEIQETVATPQSKNATMTDDCQVKNGRNIRPLIPVGYYPHGIKELMEASPAELEFGTLATSCACLSVYFPWLSFRYPYDTNELHAALLHVFVEGAQSSGKSFVRVIYRTLLKPMFLRDEKIRNSNQEYKNLKRCNGKKDAKLPEEPPCDSTVYKENISVTQLLKMADCAKQRFGQEKIFLQLSDEISAMAGKKAFADLKELNKTGWDKGSEYGQEYVSEASYSATVDFLLSIVACGTPAAMDRYFDKKSVEGGNVTRGIFIMVPSELGGEPLMMRTLDKKQLEAINTTAWRLMDVCYPDDGKTMKHEEMLDMEWLFETVKKWCGEQRQLIIKNQSSAHDTFYKRSSVSAFRMTALVVELWKMEGELSESDIQRLGRQFYMACADRILDSMLDRWGEKFEEISSSTERKPYKNVIVYDELPDEFNRKQLEQALIENGVKTPVGLMVHRWHKAGLIEKDENGKIHKTVKQKRI